MSETVTLTGTASDGTEISLNTTVELSDQSALGPELVINGDPFGSGWTFLSGDGHPPSIVGGELVFDIDETDFGLARRTAAETVTTGRYLIRYAIESISSGSVNSVMGNDTGTPRSVTGFYAEIVSTVAANQNIGLAGNTPTDAVISFFSIRRVLG